VPEELHPAVAEALTRTGIDALYAHQAEALHAAWAGPMIVTTGTASGKSMCFNLPTLDVLCRDPKARALYLYPTKALAQDQARALHAFGLARQVRPAIYDGDTRQEDRRQIRRRSNLILTNPDMLHMGVLPNHRTWADLFANLAVVVVDEAHVYRGVFGSHVANVLRRLRRIANAYGTEPRFLLASATIANPVDLAERLTGLEDIALVDRDGAPGARRQIAMWNPPVTDEALQTRRSALAEAGDVVAELVREGARTICFIKSRKGVELVARIAADALRESGDDDLAARVAPYRAGYTPQQRRELERRLTEGEVLAVVTTNALELGIDIGALDARGRHVPGTVASLRQMWGRAGRAGAGWRSTSPARTRWTSSSAAIPTSSSSGPSSRRSSTTSPRRSTWPTCCARATRARSTPRPTARSSARGCARTASTSRAGASSSSAAGPSSCAGPRTSPRPRSRCARPPRRRSGWSTWPRASCSARWRAPARTPRSIPARSTCTRAAPTRSPSWTSMPARRSWRPSTATGTRSPRRRRTPTSRSCWTAARQWAPPSASAS
jgi:superfamily II DNA/RNA helicase